MTRDEPREQEAALYVGDARLGRREGGRNRPDYAVDDFHVATNVDFAGDDVHYLCVYQPTGLSRLRHRPSLTPNGLLAQPDFGNSNSGPTNDFSARGLVPDHRHLIRRAQCMGAR